MRRGSRKASRPPPLVRPTVSNHLSHSRRRVFWFVWRWEAVFDWASGPRPAEACCRDSTVKRTGGELIQFRSPIFRAHHAPRIAGRDISRCPLLMPWRAPRHPPQLKYGRDGEAPWERWFAVGLEIAKSVFQVLRARISLSATAADLTAYPSKVEPDSALQHRLALLRCVAR